MSWAPQWEVTAKESRLFLGVGNVFAHMDAANPHASFKARILFLF